MRGSRSRLPAFPARPAPAGRCALGAGYGAASPMAFSLGLAFRVVGGSAPFVRLAHLPPLEAALRSCLPGAAAPWLLLPLLVCSCCPGSISARRSLSSAHSSRDLTCVEGVGINRLLAVQFSDCSLRPARLRGPGRQSPARGGSPGRRCPGSARLWRSSWARPKLVLPPLLGGVGGGCGRCPLRPFPGRLGAFALWLGSEYLPAPLRGSWPRFGPVPGPLEV